MATGTPANGYEAVVGKWFEAFGRCCAEEDYESARSLVADDVRSFGTNAGIVSGLDRLQADQWTAIWPSIEGFEFDLEETVALGDGDRVSGAAVWRSTGFNEDGEPFYRPGRATVVLEQRDDAWLAVHTHFSLHPGTPQYTCGPDGRTE